jgi:hypothetical protein
MIAPIDVQSALIAMIKNIRFKKELYAMFIKYPRS